MKKAELLDERDQMRERAEAGRREQVELDAIGMMRVRNMPAMPSSSLIPGSCCPAAAPGYALRKIARLIRRAKVDGEKSKTRDQRIDAWSPKPDQMTGPWP